MAEVVLKLQEGVSTDSGKDLILRCKIETEPYDPGDRDTPPYGGWSNLIGAELVSGSVYDLIRYLDADDKLADMADKELTDLYESEKLENQLDQLYYGQDREFY